MGFNRTSLYVAIAWIVSVGIAYASGWWSGVKSVTSVAAGAASSGFSLLGIGLLITIAIASVVAFMARGYLDRKTGLST